MIKKIQDLYLAGIPVRAIALTVDVSEPTVRKFTKPPFLNVDSSSDDVPRFVSNQGHGVDSNGMTIKRTDIRYNGSQNFDSLSLDKKRSEEFKQLLRRMEQYEEREKQREQGIQEVVRTLKEISLKFDGFEQKQKEFDMIKPQVESLKKEMVQFMVSSKDVNQILSFVTKELAGVKKENKDNKDIIQKYAQEFSDFKQLYNTSVELIQNHFDKLKETMEKIISFREDFEIFRKQVQNDLDSIRFKLNILGLGEVVIGGVAVIPHVVNYLQDTSQKQTTTTRTPQQSLPYYFVYDQKTDLWILYWTNGHKIISDNLLREVLEINQKIIDGTYIQPRFDEPVNDDIKQYITIARSKYASFSVPISPEGIIQLGSMKVLPITRIS